MIKDLIAIQNELKAPKGNYNSFGKYKYRSAEDILTAVKPILAKHNCQMTISDDIIAVGGRIYVKAIVTIVDADGNTETVTAFAREEETKKGMDGSQITGTASSYARKYALNGMFLIDDTKDADTDAFHWQTAGNKNLEKEPIDSYEPTFDKDFMAAHGKDPISNREIERLKEATKDRTDGKTLAAALRACNRSRAEDITYTQYLALCSNLGIAA